MLQQTRVNVVEDYFSRFIGRFPTVFDLASATEQEVLALWSGLGYYRRARMLHAAAQQIVAEHAGVLPRSAAALERLPGIGRYTASAIASICHDEVTAVVDGNVERVLERFHGKVLPRAEQWSVVNTWISPRRPGDFNQAMMELGATVCTPRAPRCPVCPVRALCASPVAPNLARPEKAAQRLKRNTAVVVDIHLGRVRLVQRSASERLMPLMWELPVAPRNMRPQFRVKHAITKTDYAVTVVTGKARQGKYVSQARLAGLPLTGLTRKVLRKTGFLI